jgi:hypothetical protein
MSFSQAAKLATSPLAYGTSSAYGGEQTIRSPTSRSSWARSG